MDWGFLSFVGEPWFVLPWYALGLLGVWFLVHDMRHANTALKPAMQWAWPIIVLFFSVIGLALYFATARPPGARGKDEEETRAAHDAYQEATWRRVNGAVIHCVAGDGAGIVTAMVIARTAGMSFWQEFWFEYAVGFAIGWLIFQRKSMTMMTDSLPKQLAMAFRGELFSMLTVMGGMGAVMTYVTPMVVGAQPKPSTFAFWGFAMLGLLVGYVFTYPMNWMLVKVGWKHGMGSMEGGEEEQVEGAPKKAAVVAAMVALGGFALFVPAWLTHARQVRSRAGAVLTPAAISPGFALYEGIHASIERAIDGLAHDDRTQAAQAMDAAMRAAEAGAHSAPGEFSSALDQIRAARTSLQQGNERIAVHHLANAAMIVQPAERARPPFLDPSRYRGAEVIDAEGATLGEVIDVSDGSFELALGGWRDVWGIFDFGAAERVRVPVSDLAFGPPRSIGARLVAVPTERARLASR